MKVLQRFLPLLLISATGIACDASVEDAGPDPTEPEPDVTALRVFHLSPDAPPVEAFLDGQPSDAGFIAFGQSTQYYELEPGLHTLNIGTTGSAQTAQLSTGPLELDARRYTAVAIDRVAGIRGILFPDDDKGLADGSIRVRAIHAAPDVGQVDVLNIGADGSATELSKNLDFGDFSGEIDVPAGAYTIGVDLDNDKISELFFQLPGLDAGTLANIYVTQNKSGDVFAYAQLEGATVAEILPAQSEIRVFHGSRDAPNVDVKVNGQRVIADLPFASSSDTLTVPSGSYDLEVLVAGTDTVIDASDVELRPGLAYTAVAYGDVANLQAAVLVDNNQDVSGSNVRFQVFHAAPEIEMGDVYSLNDAGGAGNNLVPDLGFGGYGSTPDLPKARYSVGFEADSSGLIIADFDLPSLTVSYANVFIIQDNEGNVFLVAQLEGDSTALICESSLVGDCALSL